MSGEQLGGIALGLFAALLGVGGIAAAVLRRRRRAEIANTYGSAGGIVYTIFQAGCSGLLLLGGIGLVVAALLVKPAS
ncbi:MAG: hypothetical protein E6J12_02530 [Chloroflexi bacterium]|nr:MAG: hypothetical protein E6J12_02530 [Chloroflexota bacterium]